MENFLIALLIIYVIGVVITALSFHRAAPTEEDGFKTHTIFILLILCSFGWPLLVSRFIRFWRET
jgi:hypothetical protein